MMIKKTLTILAVSCMMYSCATKTESNPFFTEFPSYAKEVCIGGERTFLYVLEGKDKEV